MLMKFLKSKRNPSETAYSNFLADGVSSYLIIQNSPHRPHEFHLPMNNLNDQLTPR